MQLATQWILLNCMEAMDDFIEYSKSKGIIFSKKEVENQIKIHNRKLFLPNPENCDSNILEFRFSDGSILYKKDGFYSLGHPKIVGKYKQKTLFKQNMLH